MSKRKKVHVNGKCEGDVYIELPEECGHGPGKRGKLNYWLYDFRPAAAAWETLYEENFETVGLFLESHAE